MNKNTIIVIFIVIGIGALILLAKSKDNDTNVSSTDRVASNSGALQEARSVVPADKIEVVHFHGTQQCWSCITVGEYALKTIKERFPEEFGSGKIVFKDINGELNENQEMVIKYQARGSSLFVNSIVGDKDNIEEEVTVWRLINNEERFTSSFEKKLGELLGK